MASLKIYTDCEKENPQRIPAQAHMKEKTAFGNNNANALQLSTLSNAASSNVAAGADNNNKNKNQLQGTGINIAPSRLANIGNGGKKRNVKDCEGPKLAFRDVSNVESTLKDGVTKKSTVVPVVERFKTFTVYEDNDGVIRGEAEKAKTSKGVSKKAPEAAKSKIVHETSIEDASKVEIDHVKEYLDIDRPHIDLKSISISNVIDSSILDGTPMSVSDVLSPMSVDRSYTIKNLDESRAEPADDNNDPSTKCQLAQKDNQENIAPVQEEVKADEVATTSKLIRNDRQRFFDVVDYQQDILKYFLESEKKHRPKPQYMRRQVDINNSMRTILVDWLVEVSEEYNLDTETLYLSVSYIDRFLSHMSVVRGKLQLVGTAAMYVAAKYEEIYPPDVSEFVFITDDTYTKEQVLRMEQIILKTLAFDLCTPTPYTFVNTYSVLVSMTDEVKFLTLYICELSLLEAEPYLRFYPSLVSSGALALARHILGGAMWSPELEEITTYRLEDMKEIILSLCKSHQAAATLAQQAIQDKYKARKYACVSNITSSEISSELYDEIMQKYNQATGSIKSSFQQQQETITTNNENVRRMISLMFN